MTLHQSSPELLQVYQVTIAVQRCRSCSSAVFVKRPCHGKMEAPPRRGKGRMTTFRRSLNGSAASKPSPQHCLPTPQPVRYSLGLRRSISIRDTAAQFSVGCSMMTTTNSTGIFVPPDGTKLFFKAFGIGVVNCLPPPAPPPSPVSLGGGEGKPPQGSRCCRYP